MNRQRNWLDDVVDELFDTVHVSFWQIVVLVALLGVALGIAFGATVT